MNYIKANCRTNLDGYDCSITSVFYAIPNKGDYVQVLYKGSVTYLKVVGILHKSGNNNQHPIIEIELNN